jgi:ankyrin repeat protein
MKKKGLIILVLAICLCFFCSAFAETIILKSGKTVEGKIINKTDKYIQIDFPGVPLTYFLNEIESIEAEKIDPTKKDNGASDIKKDVLFEAVKMGDIQKINQLMDEGVDANIKNESGSTPLVWAVTGCNKQVIELLLARGAEVNTRDTMGMTPLMWAAHRCRKDIVELLLSKGADFEIKDENGKTAWIWSAVGKDKDTVELLLSKGVDINARDNSGATALMWAAGMGKKDIVELLLSKGADINAKNNHGATAIMYARKYAEKTGQNDIAGLLTAKLSKDDDSILNPGVRFYPPNGWQENVTNDGWIVTYYQPERKASILITLPHPATNFDFTNLLVTTKKEGKLISEDNNEISGVPCRIFTYETSNSKGGVFRVKTYIFFEKGKLFTIVYMASPIDFNNYLADFEDFLSTFKVKLK